MDISSQAAPEFRLVRPPDAPGRLSILLTIIDGTIIMDFGRTIQWAGLTPEEALKLADDLTNAARVARTIHLSPEG